MANVSEKNNSGSGLSRTIPFVALGIAVVALAGVVFGGRGGDVPVPLIGANQETLSPAQKQAVEGVIKDYLVAHPEILFEVQSALEAKLAKEEAERTKALVAENGKAIYRAEGAPVAGNPDGDITVVEFFDYNCGYCKRGFSEIAKLIEKDKNVRVVFKEFPILRDESEQAARVALAARMQGKYWEVHSELLTSKGLVNEAVALKAAEKHGLDMVKLKADMDSAEVKGELERVKELAKKLSINGTPHFLVGDRAIGGAPDNLADLLEQHVVELRKTGCSYC